MDTKKTTHTVFYFLLLSAFVLSSCKRENPPVIPSIDFELKETGKTSLTYSFSSENAVECKYMYLKYDSRRERIPETTVLKAGVPFKPNETVTVTVDGLQEGEMYLLTAVAVSETGNVSSKTTKEITDGFFSVVLEWNEEKSTSTTLTFKISSEKAETASYILQPASEEAPFILTVHYEGTMIHPENEEITAYGLEPDTEYILYVGITREFWESDIFTLKMKTKGKV